MLKLRRGPMVRSNHYSSYGVRESPVSWGWGAALHAKAFYAIWENNICFSRDLEMDFPADVN